MRSLQETVADVERYCPDPAPYLAAYLAAPHPDWLDELDLKPAPPHVRMGTHTLDLADWFVFDDHLERERELRRRLLTERRDEVLAVLPSADAAAEETLELITSWLRDRGVDVPAPLDDNPLAAAGLLVQDDLCLMVQRGGDWHLDAGLLCFPSLWRLDEKLGLPTSAVHAPVSHYADELSSKVDRFFDHLPVDRAVWRRNLSLKATNALYMPLSKPNVGTKQVVVGDDGSPYWLRTERQTLRRLPRTGAILFGIRTQVAPIGVLRARPDRARDLFEMYASFDAAMGAFKTAGSNVAATLLPWLRSVASAD